MDACPLWIAGTRQRVPAQRARRGHGVYAQTGPLRYGPCAHPTGRPLTIPRGAGGEQRRCWSHGASPRQVHTSLACPEAVSWKRTHAHCHSYPPPTNSESSDSGGERGQGDRIILMIRPPQGHGGGRLALEPARDGSQALHLLRPSGWGWPLLHLLPVAYALALSR